MKIALVGKARSGKDTVADYLKTNYGFTEYKFSKGIHDTINLIKGPSDSKSKKRRELQEVGQGLRGILGDDVWVNYTFRLILQEQPEHIVISDCRQENEANRLREEGYVLINVETPDEIRIKRMIESGDKFTKEDLNHETEQIDIVCDYTIHNDRTIFDVFTQIEDIMAELTYYLEEDPLEEVVEEENAKQALYDIEYVEQLEELAQQNRQSKEK